MEIVRHSSDDLTTDQSCQCLWLKQLPTTEWTLEGLEKVPDRAGIYFISDKDCNLLYIGKSLRIRFRLNIGEDGCSHGAYDRACRICGSDRPNVSWRVMPNDEGLLLTIESALIYQYQPPINGNYGKKYTPLTPEKRASRRKSSAANIDRVMARNARIEDAQNPPTGMGNATRPCPYCKSATSRGLPKKWNDEAYYLECDTCGYATDAFPTEQEAHDMWARPVIAPKK